MLRRGIECECDPTQIRFVGAPSGWGKARTTRTEKKRIRDRIYARRERMQIYNRRKSLGLSNWYSSRRRRGVSGRTGEENARQQE